MTLTALPDDWQKARAQVFDFARRLRVDGYTWEWAWAIEVNPKGTGHHAHAVQHGSYVKQALLQERWGGRIVDVRALSKPGASMYATKEALRVAGYVTKAAGGFAEHLAVNGGRPVHMSRGFLHGETKRSALVHLRQDLAGGDRLTWALVHPGTTVRALG